MGDTLSRRFEKNLQFRKFQAYGFLKNLRFFEVFLLLFFLSIGLNFTQIGSLYAIREITRYIFEIPSGIMADSWGRRRTLASSLSAESQLSSVLAGIYALLIGFLADKFNVGISLIIVSGFLIAALLFSSVNALKDKNK